MNELKWRIQRSRLLKRYYFEVVRKSRSAIVALNDSSGGTGGYYGTDGGWSSVPGWGFHTVVPPIVKEITAFDDDEFKVTETCWVLLECALNK